MTCSFKIQHFIIILRKVACLLLMTGSAFLFSCSKDSDGPDLDSSKVYLIKTEFKHHKFGYTLRNEFSYDSLGRILSLIQVYPDNNNDTARYTYINSMSVIVVHNSYDTVMLQLDQNGLMVLETSMHEKWYTRYKYNVDDHCSMIRYYRDKTDTSEVATPYKTILYQYKLGNLVTESNWSGELIHYQYYADKINTIGNLNKGMAFKGKSSKNLTKFDDSYDSFDSLGRLKFRYVKNDTWRYNYEYYPVD